MPTTLTQSVLLLTHDDMLWQRWNALDPQRWTVERGRRVDDLVHWLGRGHRLALLDADLPGLPGWRDPIWLRVLGELRVVLASTNPRDDAATTALAAGVAGYCHAYLHSAGLARVLDAVAAGKLWLGRSLVSRLLQLADHTLSAGNTWSVSLTDRENAVIRLAVQGEPNAVIADSLGMTGQAVNTHLVAAFGKLGVLDRLQLALRVYGIH